MTRSTSTVCAICLLAGTASAADKPEGIPANYRLLYEQDFEKPAIGDFVFTEPSEWKQVKGDKNSWLELHYDRKAKPAYEPKHRSPFHIALIADKVFGDCIVEADLQSTVPPYGHQDMCLFYGFTAPDRFYYTHLAVAADPHAHNIFIVNEAPRAAIAKETTKGITWSEGQWHKVRLARDSAAGTIQVYFDDLTKPVMTASDKTFPKGYAGVGSFDDTGRIDNIRVWGTTVEDKKTDFFKRQANEPRP